MHTSSNPNVDEVTLVEKCDKEFHHLLKNYVNSRNLIKSYFIILINIIHLIFIFVSMVNVEANNIEKRNKAHGTWPIKNCDML